MAADENGGGGADARLSVYAHCAMASCPAGLVLQVCLAASLASLAASLAAAGPLQGRYTRPPFNGAAAVKCFFLSSSFLSSASNKNKNIIELQFSIHIFLHWCCRHGVGIGRKRFDQKFFKNATLFKNAFLKPCWSRVALEAFLKH